MLTGVRGWSVVAALATALAGTVALQLPAAAEGTTLRDPVPVRAADAVARPVTGPPTVASAGPSAPVRLDREQAREVRTTAAAVRAQAARATAARSAAARADVARAVPARQARRAGPARAAPARGATSTPAAPARCSGAGWQQRRGAAALASLRPAPSPASAVRFRPARSGFLGLTDLEDRSVEVFVRPCSRQSDALLRHVVAHELGHAYDVAHLTPDLRAAWMRVRGIPAGTPWFGCDRCTDFATPAGDFAETYAQWRRGARSSRSRMAPPPGPAHLERLAATFFDR